MKSLIALMCLICQTLIIQTLTADNSSNNQKTVLIVGGAGYIGSHVNKQLFQAGYNTVILDDLSNGNINTITHGTFIKGNFGNEEILDQIFTEFKIDAVMHFGAYIQVGESVKNPLKYYQNNVSSTIVLLKAMVKHNISNLIFSSSAAVYGIPNCEAVIEETPCQPINPYGETKLMMEKIIRDVSAAHDIHYCCLRYFNVAGFDPDGEIKNYRKSETNLIPIILRSLLTENGSITIFGTDYPTPDGTCVRDYIHVYDLASAHVAALEHLFDKTASQHYNLGIGRGFSVKEVINSVERVTGLKVNVIEGDRREGDPAQLQANSEKAQKELGWHPVYPNLDDIVRDAWKALH